MRVRVGYWPCDGQVCVEFLGEDARYLAAQADRFQVALEGRTLTITPAAEGMELRRHDRQAVGFTHRVEARLKGAYLPMFELHDLEAEWEEGCVCIELPADHELPWPSKRSVVALAKTKSREDLESFCEDQVQARVSSAVASGASIVPVPDHIRSYAQPGVYLRCLEAAKTLAGVL